MNSGFLFLIDSIMIPINRSKGKSSPCVFMKVARTDDKNNAINNFESCGFLFAFINIRVVKAQAKQSGTLRYASFEKIMCVGKIDANAAAVRAAFFSENSRTIL